MSAFGPKYDFKDIDFNALMEGWLGKVNTIYKDYQNIPDPNAIPVGPDFGFSPTSQIVNPGNAPSFNLPLYQVPYTGNRRALTYNKPNIRNFISEANPLIQQHYAENFPERENVPQIMRQIIGNPGRHSEYDRKLDELTSRLNVFTEGGEGDFFRHLDVPGSDYEGATGFAEPLSVGNTSSFLQDVIREYGDVSDKEDMYAALNNPLYSISDEGDSTMVTPYDIGALLLPEFAGKGRMDQMNFWDEGGLGHHVLNNWLVSRAEDPNNPYK